MKFFMILFIICAFSGCMASAPEIKEPSPKPESEQREKTVPSEVPKILGQWTTEIINKDEARVHNISIAVSQLQGVRLAPGEEFSFNRLLGERTEDKGYQKADIFVGDETEKAVGGGICQVSSTFYMAVKQAGLYVSERHSHSQAVAYAAEGEDACVNYGSMDFRFVNSIQKPIEILAATDGASVTVQIMEAE